ncbi:MAG: ferritin family protein [Spirochaetes bacterium]|nr:ferritin family protein [Spirochaetota bacterium]
MDIFDLAMQMEKEGEAYYREIAGKCMNDGLSKILNMLADDEAKHYSVFKQMKEAQNTDLIETDVLANAKLVFAKMKQSMQDFDPQIGQVELYERALEFEKTSEDFYMDKAEEVTDEKQKELFIRIAEEEIKHYFLIENIIDFVRKPDTWIEDAEFNHLDEY